MPAPAVDSSRFRHRKISVKQRLRIYKSHELKDLEQEDAAAADAHHQQRELVEIETGVEKNEEKEEHLYKILKSNQLRGNKKDLFIPTPDASQTWDEFDKYYQGEFNEPKSYIQFSAQLEDCCGTLYNMDEEDEVFLKSINESLEDSAQQLTEDEFELLMANFESSIKERQPFLSMDPESVLSFTDLKPTMLMNDVGDVGVKKQLANEIGMPEDEPFLTMFDSKKPTGSKERSISVLVEKFGEKVYDYWRQRKIVRDGNDIFPQLKSERNNDKDDNDPYICFRRRELRQPRKTRRIDVQNSQKLRLLYQQLEYAKDLALAVAKREQKALEMMDVEKTIFETRVASRNLKRKLGISGDDEDLYSTKRPKLASSVVTLKQREQMLLQQQQQEKQRLLQQQAAITSDSSVKRTKQSKGNKSQKDIDSAGEDKALDGKRKTTKNAANKKEQLQQNSRDMNKQLLGATGAASSQPNQQASQVYVKLPSSKIPDIVLEDVNKLLHSKENSTRKFVEDRMKKRKQEDGELFFNLTDDPHNPVFKLSIPMEVEPEHAPFSSVAASRFEVTRSSYCPNLDEYLEGKAPETTLLNDEGESVDNSDYKKPEFICPFDNNVQSHSREFPIAFRHRRGRGNIKYIDQRRSDRTINEILSSLVDSEEIKRQEQNNEVLDVYDSKLDSLSRSYYQWRYDSNYNRYGSRFSDEPAKLNQISNETQVVRFGTMLGSKAYEQLRDATMKYRQEQINKRKKMIALQQPMTQKIKSNSSSPRPPSLNKSSEEPKKSGMSTPKQSTPKQSTTKNNTPLKKRAASHATA